MPFGEILNKEVVRRVLTDPNSFATTMIIALADVYGPDMFTWAPETIRREAEDDFSIKWPQANFDRLMAGIALVVTDRFYKSLPDFIDLCNILSGSPATPGVFDMADAGECAWGVTEALLLYPPDDDEPFTEEIRAYIGEVVRMEGIITPPDILRIGMLQDRRLRVHNDYSDDPEMFNAVWNAEQSKTEDINDLVKGRLMLLVNQLAALKLLNGDTGEIAQKMLKNLSAQPEGGSPL